MRLRPANDYNPLFPRRVNFPVYDAVNRLRTPYPVHRVSELLIADRSPLMQVHSLSTCSLFFNLPQWPP